MRDEALQEARGSAWNQRHYLIENGLMKWRQTNQLKKPLTHWQVCPRHQLQITWSLYKFQPISDLTKNFFFDFLKVHNKLGKVTTPFFLEKWTVEKSAGWFSPPPLPNRVNVKKALDLVSHHQTLFAACQQIGLPELLIHYILGMYELGSNPLINSVKVLGLVLIMKGVKQGNPLSCFIFSIAIDWVLTVGSHKVGSCKDGSRKVRMSRLKTLNITSFAQYVTFFACQESLSLALCFFL